KGFDHKVGPSELSRLAEYMGDNFVCFLASDSEGNPAGAWVRIYSPGGLAVAWSAGVKNFALKDGVNNFLGQFALDYFADKGCEVFDFVGANIAPVAEMKEAWGGELVCYYSIREQNWRNLARAAYMTTRSIIKS